MSSKILKSDLPPKKRYFKHSQCGFTASESHWLSNFVYFWHYKNRSIRFFRCSNCLSDIANESLENVI